MYFRPLTFHLGTQKLKNVKIVEVKVFLYIFALKVEPAKPLDNAQIGRSFFNIIPMPKFNKTNRTADDLIVVLKRKGLSIADEAKSINYIRNIGYYRLKAYFYPLYQEPKHKHLFKVDATFDKVMNMYRFDRKLRLLLFNEIEKIEVAFRSIIESHSAQPRRNSDNKLCLFFVSQSYQVRTKFERSICFMAASMR